MNILFEVFPLSLTIKTKCTIASLVMSVMGGRMGGWEDGWVDAWMNEWEDGRMGVSAY